MTLKRYPYINDDTATTSGIEYLVGDTFADLPSSGLTVGSLGFTKDNQKLYVATSTTTFAEKGAQGPPGAATTYIPIPFVGGDAATGVLSVAAGAWRWPNNTGSTLTIVRVSAIVATAPTGANLICDVNVNGSTIWATQGNRITIAAGATTGTTTTFNTTTIANGSYLTADVDQVGSGVAGSYLTLQVLLQL